MRRPRAKTARLAAVTVLAAASVAACGLSSSSSTNNGVLGGPTGTPITVGVSEPLTGAFAADGQASLKGYQLWVSDVNAQGGLLGRPVKLIWLNDKSDPATTAKNYTTLITQDHVSLTLGPFSSLLTESAAPVANKHGYALVEGSGGAPGVFALNLPNVFDVSAPVAENMVPFAEWLKALPPGAKPKTIAYAMVNDPFAMPPVESAEKILANAGITTVYNNLGSNVPGLPSSTGKPYAENAAGTVPVSVLTAAADKLVALHPDVVVIGSVDIPTVSTFINVFKARGFNPQMIIAASGPDQGQAFLDSIGTSNADGIMVPDGWFGAYPNALSHVMVQDYIAKYGGTASDINADVAEAYSAGQVVADAVGDVGLNQAKIINFLHNPTNTLNTVQGPASWARYVKGQPAGQNTKAVAFIFQWQSGARFTEVLSNGGKPTPGLKTVKPAWATGLSG
jgi:branched-chain amino acid transport system substrate-binding protein